MRQKHGRFHHHLLIAFLKHTVNLDAEYAICRSEDESDKGDEEKEASDRKRWITSSHLIFTFF